MAVPAEPQGVNEEQLRSGALTEEKGTQDNVKNRYPDKVPKEE